MKLFKRKPRNPGCFFCRHYCENGDKCLLKIVGVVLSHQNERVDMPIYRAGCEKNRNRRCQDFEAKENK